MRRFTLTIAAAALLALTSSDLLASPQETLDTQPSAAQAPATTFKTSVENVVIDVIVTDAAGKPVTGLRREDFSVYEDGQAQTIQFFTSLMSSSSGDAATEGRSIIVLDAHNAKFEDFAYAVSSVKKMLSRRKVLPQPTALMLLNEHGLKVLQDYDTDSSTIIGAMDRWRRDISISLRGAAMPFSDMVNLSLGAMEQLAQANLGSGRRQSVVWVSAGIQTQYLQSGWSSNLTDYIRALTLLSDEMLRSRTTLNAVDPQGVGTGRTTPLGLLISPDGNYPSGDLATVLNTYESGVSNLTLGTLTQQTGGEYLLNRNDVDSEIARVLEDSAGAYTIAYSPANHDFNGKFRKLKVEVTTPGLAIRTRPGYFAVPDSTLSNPATKYEINHAVTTQVNYGAIAMQLQAASPVADKQPVTVAVDSHALDWRLQSDGQYRARIELLAVSFNDKQKALYSVRRTMSANLAAAAYAAALARPWNIAVDMPFDKSATRLRVVLRDLYTNRIGSAGEALP